jgi:hypothetical protein
MNDKCFFCGNEGSLVLHCKICQANNISKTVDIFAELAAAHQRIAKLERQNFYDFFERVESKAKEITTLKTLVREMGEIIIKQREWSGSPPRDKYSFDSIWEDTWDRGTKILNLPEVKVIMKRK